jgi:hypothetical protein
MVMYHSQVKKSGITGNISITLACVELIRHLENYSFSYERKMQCPPDRKEMERARTGLV